MTSLQPVCNKGPQCLQHNQISHTSFCSPKLLLPHYLLVQTCLSKNQCSCSLESLSSICTILPASFHSFISDNILLWKAMKAERQIFSAVQQHRHFENLILQTEESTAQELNHQIILFTVHSSGRHRDD